MKVIREGPEELTKQNSVLEIKFNRVHIQKTGQELVSVLGLDEIKQIIPPFNPDNSFSLSAAQWIDFIEKIRQLYEWDDQCTISYASLCLDEAASKWFAGQKQLITSWIELKRKLLEDFPSISDEMDVHVSLLPQQKQEPKRYESILYGNLSHEFKVYKRRYVVLILFSFYSALNAMQWIQYSIISNIITKYYGVSENWVNWTSMIYMILYIPLIFPGSWFLDKMGLRITALVGVCGTCIGAWIKVFSVDPELFYVSFIGQAVVAFAQVCILSLPARVAAVWFGPNQVSSACSVGVFGNQLGIAVGFVLPPMLVANSDNLDEIGADLKVMFYLVAGATSVLVVLMVLFFQDRPPTPPSAAQEATQPNPDGESTFIQSLKNLVLNKNYILLLTSYGMNVGVFYAISTLLNPVVLKYYPGHEVDTGRIGLCIVVAGMLGSVVCGIVLDKTHRFKETTLAVYAFSMVGMWVFSFTLDTGHIAVVYVTAGLLGFFMTGYLPVGFEFGAELTYPEPEGTSAGLLNAAAQVFGIGFTMLYSELLTTYGDITANVTMAIFMCIGTVVTALIGSDLKRQAAQGPGAIANP